MVIIGENVITFSMDCGKTNVYGRLKKEIFLTLSE